MKYINKSFLILALVAIPTLALLSHQVYSQTIADLPCQSLDDCPLGFGDCAPDPGGGSNLVCIPMFCSFDSDCLSGMCDIGVCALPSAAPGLGAVVDAVVVSANDPETGACELGKVDTQTGEYTKMFDAGCSECGGVDMDDNGNLVVACGDDTDPLDTGVAKRGVLLGKLREIETRTGRVLSDNVHGVSNYISDIAILPDRSVLSHETIDEDTIHEHDQIDNLLANPLGPTGLDVERAGLAYNDMRWRSVLATNVDGQPALYQIDPDTGEATFNIALQLPPEVVIASAATRAVALKDIHIQALDYLQPIAVVNPSPIIAAEQSTRAGLVPVEDADYVVLLTNDDPMTGETDGWAAFGLVDDETGYVDRIIDIQSNRDLEFTGLTVLQPIQRNVPTLSEWGLIGTAVVLGFIGFLAIRKRKAAL